VAGEAFQVRAEYRPFPLSPTSQIQPSGASTSIVVGTAKLPRVPAFYVANSARSAETNSSIVLKRFARNTSLASWNEGIGDDNDGRNLKLRA